METTVTVLYYQTASGTSPFGDWMNALGDRIGRGIIDARIGRVRRGLLGNVRSVGGGLYELKIHYGPGYRIYFMQDRSSQVILLCGGDKSSQAQDIARAREYSLDYWRRKA